MKRILAMQLADAMKERNLTKVEMARRMRTSRVQLDRLLDPDNDSVTLATLCRAAVVVGREQWSTTQGKLPMRPTSAE